MCAETVDDEQASHFEHATQVPTAVGFTQEAAAGVHDLFVRQLQLGTSEKVWVEQKRGGHHEQVVALDHFPAAVQAHLVRQSSGVQDLASFQQIQDLHGQLLGNRCGGYVMLDGHGLYHLTISQGTNDCMYMISKLFKKLNERQR